MSTPVLEVWGPHGQATGVRLGFDITQVSAVANSIRQFGRRFTDRLFTSHELDYSLAGGGNCAERLAARFAAKEATMKALSLSEEGVNWRDIEVVKSADGACVLRLHGRAHAVAERLRVTNTLLSLSHDGDYAAAVVQVITESTNREETLSHDHDD